MLISIKTRPRANAVSGAPPVACAPRDDVALADGDAAVVARLRELGGGSATVVATDRVSLRDLERPRGDHRDVV